ncbi:MAG TPA: hypothetical protein VK605_04445, partial [Solirubrobacteraceae bacterium]|nr:hypothetical protein [Solirubrobacteraceae bacterium]
FAPRERKLAELAERDIAAADQTSPGAPNVVFGAEYNALRKQVLIVGLAANAVILLTIYFMTAQVGA